MQITINKCFQIYHNNNYILYYSYHLLKIYILLRPKRKMRQNAVMTYIFSCLSYKTEEVCENLYLKFKKDRSQKERKIHSILTYQMENNSKGVSIVIRTDVKTYKKYSIAKCKQEKDLKNIEENIIIKVSNR